MRRFLLILFFIPTTLPAQISKDSIPDFIPKWSVQIDLINFQDNYPAVLLSLERQFDEYFSVHQEFGPVLAPEAYNNADFEKYLGFKSRTEFRLFMDQNLRKRSRTFLAVDFAYQVDQYVFDYFRGFDGFNRIEEGTFVRHVYGSHIRGGYQRVFRDRIIISYSVGLGRLFYKMDSPKGYSEGVNSQNITDYPPLDPFSMNFRLKFGIILSKLAE